MKIINQNLSFNFIQSKDKKIENDIIFENCNFTQINPNTEIFKNIKGITFKNCNLTNCKIPNDSLLINCNTTQIAYCSNNNPELIKFGLLECKDKICIHEINSDRIINGIYYPLYKSEKNKINEEIDILRNYISEIQTEIDLKTRILDELIEKENLNKI